MKGEEEMKMKMTLEAYAWRAADLCGWEVMHGTTANGTPWTGIRGNGAVARVIHLDEPYRRGLPPEAAAEMARRAETGETPEIKFPLTWDEAKGMLRMRLLPETSEQDVRRPADGFPGLILSPCVLWEVTDGTMAAAAVTEGMLALWDASEDEVMEAAEVNTVPECEMRNLGELLAEMLGVWLPEGAEAIPAAVCTNRRQQFGAAAGYYLRDRLKEVMGGEYVLIPSSVHEMIAVPAGVPGDFVRMLNEVNEECVAPEERLASRVYEVR